MQDKIRIVVDSTASGLNPALQDRYFQLDQVDDALRGFPPGAWLSKFDLSDAFLLFPVEATQCDLLGFRDTEGNFYRYRFAPFGVSLSPLLCQRFAKELQTYVNREGLKYVSTTLSNGDVNPACVATNFRCVAAYLDDYLNIHHPSLTKDQAAEQVASVDRVVGELGATIRQDKWEGPSTDLSYLGIALDTEEGTVGVAAEKAESLSQLIERFLHINAPGAEVSRQDLSKLVGKLQFYVPFVTGAQSLLTEAYRSRDSLLGKHKGLHPSSKAAWRKGVQVELSQEARSDLSDLTRVLRTCSTTRFYPHDDGCARWRNFQFPSHKSMDECQLLFGEAVVITTDASGFGGGGFGPGFRFQFHFDPADRAPHRSSNWREFMTAKRSIMDRAHELAGKRVLLRTDNEVTRCILNKHASSSKELNRQYKELAECLREHQIDLVSVHIRGVENGLADALSRWERPFDDQDWKLSKREFEKLGSELGPFEVDACADLAGYNAQCEEFWTELDDCAKQRWAGRRVYCNPPFNGIQRILKHALSEWASHPGTTSATFVLPQWEWAPWYALRKHFQVHRTYQTGSRLFTSPDWREIANGGGQEARCDRGPTQWPVEVWHKAPLSKA